MFEGINDNNSRVKRKAMFIGISRKMCHSGFCIMRHRSPKFFFCNFFVRNSFDNVRSGDKHIRGIFDHHVKICNGRRINRAAGTGS